MRLMRLQVSDQPGLLMSDTQFTVMALRLDSAGLKVITYAS
jgi:hypothetical protein